MKRIGNLYDQVCNLDNLYLAYNKAKSGKSNSYGVKLFEMNLEANIKQLYAELLTGIYECECREQVAPMLKDFTGTKTLALAKK